LGDLVWVNPWTPLVRSKIFRKLNEEGLSLTGVTAQFRLPNSDKDPLIELEALPGAELHPSCIPANLPDPCPACGRCSFPLPHKIMIDARSLVNTISIQRLRNFTTLVLVNEHMAAAITDLNLADISLKEVRVFAEDEMPQP